MIFDGILIFLNTILFLYAEKISIYLNHGEKSPRKIFAFRVFNIVMIGTSITDIFFPDSLLTKAGYTLVILYLSFMAYEILSYFNRKKFGTRKERGEEVIYEDNYNSRINNIILVAFIFFIALVSVLKAWGMEDSLQQTGMIGIVLAFLALTSSHWLPGIVSGLTLMNSRHVSKGDVLKIEEKIYLVFDIGFFYTVLFNVQDNARVLIDNTTLSKKEIENLSRRASLDGYRVSVLYKIGYPGKEVSIADYMKKFRTVVSEAMEQAEKSSDIKINANAGHEVFLVESGDFALHIRVSFYLDEMKNLSSTKGVRRHMASKYKVMEIIQEKAHAAGIDFATPVLEIDVPYDR